MAQFSFREPSTSSSPPPLPHPSLPRTPPSPQASDLTTADCITGGHWWWATRRASGAALVWACCVCTGPTLRRWVGTTPASAAGAKRMWISSRDLSAKAAWRCRAVHLLSESVAVLLTYTHSLSLSLSLSLSSPPSQPSLALSLALTLTLRLSNYVSAPLCFCLCISGLLHPDANTTPSMRAFVS